MVLNKKRIIIGCSIFVLVIGMIILVVMKSNKSANPNPTSTPVAILMTNPTSTPVAILMTNPTSTPTATLKETFKPDDNMQNIVQIGMETPTGSKTMNLSFDKIQDIINNRRGGCWSPINIVLDGENDNDVLERRRNPNVITYIKLPSNIKATAWTKTTNPLWQEVEFKGSICNIGIKVADITAGGEQMFPKGSVCGIKFSYADT